MAYSQKRAVTEDDSLCMRQLLGLRCRREWDKVRAPEDKLFCIQEVDVAAGFRCRRQVCR